MVANSIEKFYSILATVEAGDLIPIIPARSFSSATDGQWFARADAIAPGVQSITFGTGLQSTPNPITLAGIARLADTAVVPATYGDATHTVQLNIDQQGRITFAQAIAIAPQGDVLGPASAVANNFAVFNGTTGKLIKDGGVPGALATLSSVDLAHLTSAIFQGFVNGTISESHAGGVATFALKTYAGTDPTAADPIIAVFRSATPGLGTVSILTITAATSFSFSSGSTVGATNGVPFKLWLVGFNDAGTFRLGAINALSGTNIYPVGRSPVDSSTAEGNAGGADSALTFYTGTAVSAKAYLVLGYAAYESGLAAVGTWDVSPTTLQCYSANIPLPGDVIQVRGTNTGAYATGTTVIPRDDTIPQIGEGDEYMTQAIIPVSGTNLLHVEHQGMYSDSVTAYQIVALFKDAVANALAATMEYNPSASVTVTISHKILAAVAAVSQTFRIRSGLETAGSTYFNGASGARIFGGAANSILRITEYQA